jgi:xylose isomerase
MKPAFPEISKIAYEGPTSKNPLAFKQYDPTRVIENRTMAEHLRFSVAYWHTFRNILSDPFGAGTAVRPWDDGSASVENACNRARVAFEFIEKLGAPFYAFHDRDVAPEGASLGESNRNLDAVVKVLKETNHAALAGHTTHHECEVAAAAGALGTLDANTGDEMIGWDTDQSPTNLYLTTQVMLTVQQ